MHINLHKTFSTPHGGGGPGAGPVVLSAALARYAPYPWIVKDGDKWRVAEDGAKVDGTPIGRLKAFHGQMGMFTRALAYIMSHGADGLKQAAEDAVLSANYVMAALHDTMSPAFDGPCMHEALFDDSFLKRYRRQHARLCQGDDRRGLSPHDHVLPAGHGAMLIEPTGEPGQGRPRSLHRRLALAGRARQEWNGGRGLPGGAPLRAAPPPRRNAGGAQANPAMAAVERLEAGSGVDHGSDGLSYPGLCGVHPGPAVAGPRFRGGRPLVDDPRHNRGLADDGRRLHQLAFYSTLTCSAVGRARRVPVAHLGGADVSGRA
jgi:hypothetical protein